MICTTPELNSELSVESLYLSSPHVLLATLQALRQQVESQGEETFSKWRSHIERIEFFPSVLNLAQYLALRQNDLRELQAALIGDHVVNGQKTTLNIKALPSMHHR